jgi:hypothetical protein
MDKKIISIKNSHEGQFQYLGRWVDKEHFRAFVYNEKGEQKLANSYKDYESLTASGIWFASNPDASQKGKKKDGRLCTNS